MKKDKPKDGVEVSNLMIERRKAFYDRIDTGELTIAETLKLMRKLADKTQKEFAQLVKVTLPVIRAIEQNKANPTTSTLNKIGAVFGLEVKLARKNPMRKSSSFRNE